MKRRTDSVSSYRHLIVVLGDQLNADAAAWDDFDDRKDGVFMAEVTGESDYVWSTKTRTALFLAAMRHFRDAQRKAGRRVTYVTLDDPDNTQTLAGELQRAVRLHAPERLILVEPGEWRVREALTQAARAAGVPQELRPDRHFFCGPDDFARHAAGRKQLRMEFFYREQRRRHRILLDEAGGPEGGEWNFDPENRGSFGREGPGRLRPPVAFPPDAVTSEVLALVERRFADRPGKLERFDWPVTPAQARRALDDFIAHRLGSFGRYQDAMWEGEPWLYHSRLSAAMNLKLLDPRVVVAAAERAYREGKAPLADVEGFIRQILGWREYVRGVYWLHMPGYLERNALGASQPLPGFYWTGETSMACLRSALRQSLDLGYAHHIQRLMVTGLYSLMLGVRPRDVHAWYLAVYVDAVEWVELPNTLGMSQYADGGVMASKPYVATGRYIQRMSNACAGCPYDPERSTGDRACPFTTLYWDFLLTHEGHLASNPRMSLQVRNLARLGPAERVAIQARARQVRAQPAGPALGEDHPLLPLS
ncbi:MAG: cryptochrome/photolyase family protein [Opitutaceae bacterium]|jgi:deoxyribodipyrimidine photolyase-related protein|nr:cryptochrome/photolyase family protein [Opitutaceae bacterium]